MKSVQSMKFINFVNSLYRNVGVIQLNNINKKNALCYDMTLEMNKIINDISRDENIKIIIIESLCENVFSSGHDLSELHSLQNKPSQLKTLVDECSNLMLSINKSNKIFISEVKGLATASGFQLALACDEIIATQNSRFSIPGVNIGLYAATPAVNIIKYCPSKIGFQILFTGKSYSAIELYNYGVISNVIQTDDKLTDEQQKIILRENSLLLCDKILNNLEDYHIKKQMYF